MHAKHKLQKIKVKAYIQLILGDNLSNNINNSINNNNKGGSNHRSNRRGATNNK